MIKNDNGNEYEIIEQFEKYMLLENHGNTGNKFVVAYNYNQESQTWQHGNYFDDRKEAQRYFESRKE